MSYSCITDVSSSVSDPSPVLTSKLMFLQPATSMLYDVIGAPLFPGCFQRRRTWEDDCCACKEKIQAQQSWNDYHRKSMVFRLPCHCRDLTEDLSSLQQRLPKTYRRRSEVESKTIEDVPQTYQKRIEDVPKTYRMRIEDVPKDYRRRTEGLPKTYRRTTKDEPKSYRRTQKSDVFYLPLLLTSQQKAKQLGFDKY